MSTVQDPRKTWLATGSLLTVWWKMQSLGLRLKQPLASWIWLLHACLSASGNRGPYMAADLLSFGIHSFVLWARQGAPRGIRAFLRKVFCLFVCFLSLWSSYNLGCYLTLAPSYCPQDIQAWSLSQGLLMQPISLCPAPTHWWWTGLSVPLFRLCLLLQLGTYSVFFVFPPGCCPLRFKNSP